MSNRTLRTQTRFPARYILACAVWPTLVTLAGCNVNEFIYGTVGATLVGAHSPASEIEQVYYLGVFDPLEQVPETVYRITIHGQASAMSTMKYGSGWVRAELIDSLQSSAGFQDVKGSPSAQADTNDNGEEKKNASDLPYVEGTPLVKSLSTGRRLIMFGPEGFREAPKDHRLVVVMGASPEKFFRAIDESLGLISQVRMERRNSALAQTLIEVMIEIKNERLKLSQLKTDIAKDMPETKGAQG